MANLFSGPLAASAPAAHNLQTLRRLSADGVWCCRCWKEPPAANLLVNHAGTDLVTYMPYPLLPNVLSKPWSMLAKPCRGDESCCDWAYLDSLQPLLEKLQCSWAAIHNRVLCCQVQRSCTVTSDSMLFAGRAKILQHACSQEERYAWIQACRDSPVLLAAVRAAGPGCWGAVQGPDWSAACYLVKVEAP